ncbi:Piwi domain-containing protein [Irpex rosettiformis]|uniref:Piwi domain-containing protein n=1 Tax=Irpex rosettiformis TaxID=378272 RepID=A0ACB8UIC2_9APHY|nr:Piwi domain-containing protein [Irpex rosettiformis]
MATSQQPAQPLPYGVVGRPTTVKTNFFTIRSLPRKTFYHYDVVIMRLDYRRLDPNGQPQRKEVKLQRRYMDIINRLHDQHEREFTPRPSYDGVKNMFSSVRHQNKTYTVEMTKDPKVGMYEVRIALVNEIHPHLYQKLIQPGSHNIETIEPRKDRSDPSAAIPPLNTDIASVMLLQVLVLQAPHIQHKFSLHSRAFYIEKNPIALSGGLQALKGFFQSVRPFLGKFLINVDTTTAAFYKPGPLLDLAVAHLRVRDLRELSRACQDRVKLATLRMFLRNLKVMIVPDSMKISENTSISGSCRVVEIRDIKPKAGYITFDGPHGVTTIKDYWQQTSNGGLQYPDAFGISSGRDAIFPAEKCYVLPGQRFSRKLSPEDMRTFLKYSMWKPPAKIQAIEGAVDGPVLNYKSSSWMRDANLDVDPRALQIQGRTIPPPQIGYNKSNLNVTDGKWNIMGKRFFISREIQALAILDFDSRGGPSASLRAFVDKLFENMRILGIAVPREFHYQAGNQQMPQDSLSEAAQAATRHLPLVNGHPVRPDIVIVILPNEAGPIRHTIKYYGDVVHGLATQCVRGGKYDIIRDPQRAARSDWNSLDQYCNNVALKINTKLGGTNSIFLSQPVEKCLHHAMVVGCDISHPAPGVKNRPSIASLVASIDPTCTKYGAHVRCQDPRLEVIEDLGGMLLEAIESYRKRAANVPERIIIYRDGVSEGEYARVLANEMKQVEHALYAIHPRPPYKPSIVFIIVGKRHHVRFFPVDPSSGDRNGNCKPGLVIDKDIVHSRFPSFYLLSHAGILGTSRPSHYIVLNNEPNWDLDQLQAVSYALCHAYAPSTRSVSIPAPVYCKSLASTGNKFYSVFLRLSILRCRQIVHSCRRPIRT